MAEERILRCDKCGTARNVDKHVLEFGPDAAWVTDLCQRCHSETVAEISGMLALDPVSVRIARARRAAYLGEAPYKAAAGVSLTDVRSWAQRNGVPCPERGRIKAAVINLYKTCQEKSDRYLQTKEAQRIVDSLS